jgi:hypothetical protein
VVLGRKARIDHRQHQITCAIISLFSWQGVSMAQPFGLILLLLISSAAIHGQESSPRGDQQVKRIPLTRTLRFPVLNALDASGLPSPGNRAAMAIWPGATDEPPEGPSGFDVFADGSLVVTDPLSRRLVLYDSQGMFKQAWEIGFRPDSVTVTQDGLMLVREANTGQTHIFDREGKTRSGEVARLPVQRQAHVLSRNSGTVPSAFPNGPAGGLISVRFEEPGSALLSLESLATDPDRGTFVAIETTAPQGTSDGINVKKTVRRYSPQGTLLSETSAIPLDYYVLPVDELRVRNGIIYQLMTTRSEVRINEWNTN